jgi:hypothetical protein
MNNTFSLNRFIRLFKKHTLEHAKTYLLSTGVLAGIIAIGLGVFAFTNGGRLAVQVQAIIFIYILAVAGSIFTSLIFADLGDKRKANQVLTLPASHLEKFLVTWIYSFIIYQLLCVGVFYLVDWIIIGISHPPVNDPNKMINVFDMEQRAPIAFIIYAVFHGFTLWGAICFEKLHFIKTAFIFFLYVLVFTVINTPILQFIIGRNELRSALFQQFSFEDTKRHWDVWATDNMDHTTLIVFAIAVIILWLSAFFRLKEKEI